MEAKEKQYQQSDINPFLKFLDIRPNSPLGNLFGMEALPNVNSKPLPSFPSSPQSSNADKQKQVAYNTNTFHINGTGLNAEQLMTAINEKYMNYQASILA